MSDDESRKQFEAASESEEESERERRDKVEAERKAAEVQKLQQQQEEERKRREEEARREEVAQERQRKQQEKQRQEAEATKKQRKPGQKRRGLGGLSKEKKRMLKQLIMQKAAEIMKAERKKEQEKRDEYVRSKIGTLNLENLNENELRSKVNQLHEQLRQLEGEKYDWEEKLRRQDVERFRDDGKANDNKGKFVKPVLKKVSKTESHMARFEKKETGHSLSSFRNQLKSTGHSKYALEEKDETGGKADWRDQLKPKEEEAAAQ
ncbi:Troponin i [Fasciola gigantica]|uniref:Troponin i n=1 Tax=Fasciola gigantica TaxID=46835 RepID=A0A504Y7D9_FASGI|nr:Troponin i [Fasciola gigantica]